jgi:predicted alpha/beta hydrolase
MNNFEEKEIITADENKIIGRIFLPMNEISGSVLIVPAMGTMQDYYAAFASWLAQQGYLTVTFDYRGTGLSRKGTLRGFQTTIMDWIKFDCAAMVEFISALSPDKALHWIGHSLGGQILPFLPNREKISKIINVAAGSGYWRYNSPPLNKRAWWLWNIVVPITVFIFGYFPGKRLGIVGDLPKGVIEQWRLWCLNPDYCVGIEGAETKELFAAVQIPMLSLSFSDDEFMSEQSIESLNNFYNNSPKTIKRIRPDDIGMKKIGHFGFFKIQYKELLWSPYLLTYLVSSNKN